MSREASKETLKCLAREEHTPVESGAVINAEPLKPSDAEPPKSSDKTARNPTENKFSAKDVEKLLEEKEAELKDLFEKRTNREIYLLKDRCDYILLNEQIRASHMLREAHRERQEKISALQTQLECKNLAALMYVLCTERRKSKLEKLRIIEEYTNYIFGLQNILVEAQELILHFSRGYKTAARVDYEWKEKMRKVLREFLSFINDFAGGTPETNQYFFDLPKLLKINAPIEDNPEEDPCACLCDDGKDEDNPCNCDDDQTAMKGEQAKEWYRRIDEDSPPFIMFGDMEQFKPPQRREVLRKVKAAKTAPRKWKEYAFNEMFLKSNCPRADDIKHVYPERIPTPTWECHIEAANTGGYNNINRNANSSKLSFVPRSRQPTSTSVDIRGGMGSILKLMTLANVPPPPPENKGNILGARDSYELHSEMKVRRESRRNTEPKVEILNINAKRHVSVYSAEPGEENFGTDYDTLKVVSANKDDDDDDEVNNSKVSSIVDSLQMQSHQPEPDHKIHYEKVCPMEKCRRMQVDDFMRSLPPYMRANPFTHFEQTFEDYEPCTPEQLQILKSRINEKKLIEKSRELVKEPEILDEWVAVPGVAVQTSELSLSLPPCSCRAPSPTPVSSTGNVFDLMDLVPVKETLDRIHESCFYDDRIQFDRFKVIGEESYDSLPKTPKDTGKARLQEITKVLKVHPSLLDIFQGNQQ